MQITKEIKKMIEAKVYERDGQKYISIGNCRLDFSKEYLYFGHTLKTLKLGWKNGTELIKVQGKIFKSYNHIKIYTEGYSFIEKIGADT